MRMQTIGLGDLAIEPIPSGHVPGVLVRLRSSHHAMSCDDWEVVIDQLQAVIAQARAEHTARRAQTGLG